MQSVWHAVAAYYQNHFDNTILLLKRKKERKAKCKYLSKILTYCDILKRSVLIYLLKRCQFNMLEYP